MNLNLMKRKKHIRLKNYYEKNGVQLLSKIKVKEEMRAG